MKSQNQTIPGYKINEYLLVLTPGQDLEHKISAIKKEFSETYKSNFAIGGRPQITLARFTQLEMMEERILLRLQAIAMGSYPIKMELRDYGSFPSHTIYINVTTKLPVRNLVKKVKEVQRLMKLDNDHKPHFIDEPYIVIARKLLPWQYEKGWLEFSNRHFTGRFISDGMLLLKRKMGELAYQVVQRLEFKNLPVNTKQGEILF
ncbi:MAG: hypothetical protein C5B52_06180 [Bacteroidetes bacterium]|nr:MAG: hypothetical protein C5B52_06180 [Bacteroidota bacterium]